jgi:hypothetical protein
MRLRALLAAAAVAAALAPAAPALACVGECDPCDNLWTAVSDATLGVVPDRDWSCVDSAPQF